MTVSYSGSFSSLLFRWKASVWKAVWRELLIWLLMYYSLRFTIHYAVSREHLIWVRSLVNIFAQFTTELPIEFMLGFYVSQVISRWWSQVLSVPWPDEAMALVNSIFPTDDRESKLKRHSIARYLILTQILALRGVSTRVRRRFPTVDHVLQADMMTPDEHEYYKNTTCESVRWQLPLQWAQNLVVPLIGSERGQLPPVEAVALFTEFNKFREKLRILFAYDWICIPLVYTQATGEGLRFVVYHRAGVNVESLSGVGLYGYFALCLLGGQYVDDKRDIYIPFLIILKFIFYIGWFKAAQDLLRPFGEDDDDVELNYLLDRHAQVSMAMADYICTQDPPLYVDRFFESKHVWLPHTKLSAEIDDHPPSLHTHMDAPRRLSLFEMVDRSEKGARSVAAKNKNSLDPTAALASPNRTSVGQQSTKKKKAKKEDSREDDDNERVLYF